MAEMCGYWVIVLFMSGGGRTCRRLAVHSQDQMKWHLLYWRALYVEWCWPVCVRAISCNFWALQCRKVITSAIDVTISPNRYDHSPVALLLVWRYNFGSLDWTEQNWLWYAEAFVAVDIAESSCIMHMLVGSSSSHRRQLVECTVKHNVRYAGMWS